MIGWTAPSDNGSEILSYTIKIRKSDGASYVEHLATCDGTDATIIANLECTVTLATLTATPYSLSLGDGIFAKVSATNIKGESVYSDEGS